MPTTDMPLLNHGGKKADVPEDLMKAKENHKQRHAASPDLHSLRDIEAASDDDISVEAIFGDDERSDASGNERDEYHATLRKERAQIRARKALNKQILRNVQDHYDHGPQPVTASKWPDPQSSTGKLLKVLLKDDDQTIIWEATGPALEAYRTLSPAISDYLTTYTKTTAGPLNSHVYMMGRTAATARPTIMFYSNDLNHNNDAKRVREAVKASKILDPYPAFRTGHVPRPQDFHGLLPLIRDSAGNRREGSEAFLDQEAVTSKDETVQRQQHGERQRLLRLLNTPQSLAEAAINSLSPNLGNHVVPDENINSGLTGQDGPAVPESSSQMADLANNISPEDDFYQKPSHLLENEPAIHLTPSTGGVEDPMLPAARQTPECQYCQWKPEPDFRSMKKLKQAVQKHIKRNHESQDYHCPVCSQAFKNRPENVKPHVFRKHRLVFDSIYPKTVDVGHQNEKNQTERHDFKMGLWKPAVLDVPETPSRAAMRRQSPSAEEQVVPNDIDNSFEQLGTREKKEAEDLSSSFLPIIESGHKILHQEDMDLSSDLGTEVRKRNCLAAAFSYLLGQLSWDRSNDFLENIAQLDRSGNPNEPTETSIIHSDANTGDESFERRLEPDFPAPSRKLQLSSREDQRNDNHTDRPEAASSEVPRLGSDDGTDAHSSAGNTRRSTRYLQTFSAGEFEQSTAPSTWLHASTLDQVDKCPNNPDLNDPYPRGLLPRDIDDDIYSIASLTDSINSTASSGNSLGQAGVNYIAAKFTQCDTELLALYTEASKKLSQVRFVDNNRRLLKLFHLDVAREVETALHAEAVSFLKSRRRRAAISLDIFRTVIPDDQEIMSLTQREEEFSMLNRYLSSLDVIDHNTGDDLEDSTDEDSESNVDSREQSSNAAVLRATGDYLVTSQAFSAYKHRLHQFIHPSHQKEQESVGSLARSATIADPLPTGTASQNKTSEIDESGLMSSQRRSESPRQIPSNNGDEGQDKVMPAEVLRAEHKSDFTSDSRMERLQEFSPSNSQDQNLDISEEIFSVSKRLTQWITDRIWPPPAGSQRIWYLCGCGRYTYIDVTELEPGGVESVRQNIIKSVAAVRGRPISSQSGGSSIRQPSLATPPPVHPSSSSLGAYLPTTSSGTVASTLPSLPTGLASPAMAPTSPQPRTMHLLVCVGGREYETLAKVRHVEITSDWNDVMIRKCSFANYLRAGRIPWMIRDSSVWEWWHSWVPDGGLWAPLHMPSTADFVKFQVFSQVATAEPYPDQFECGQWPSLTDPYLYEPVPMRLTTLNIPLWHELKYPDPHLRHQWYNAAAKKLDGRLFDDPFPNFDSIPNIVGYGIRINERLNDVLILWWAWLAILVTGIFIFVLRTPTADIEQSPSFYTAFFLPSDWFVMSSESLKYRRKPSSAHPVSTITGEDASEDVNISMRYHGRLFVLDLSVSNFRNSPNATQQYLRNIKPILPYSDGEYDGITDTEAFEWFANIFEPIFSQLAPDFTLSFDPAKIQGGLYKPLLSEFLFPETFGCRLEAQDEEFIPVHVDNEGSLAEPRSFLDGDLLDELKTWARFFEPSELEVFFQRPEQALYLMPELVLADLDKSGHKTLCFFKHFGLASENPMARELAVHKKVRDAKLGPDLHVSRLQGIVHIQDEDATLGLLLSLVDHEEGMTLQSALYDDPPRYLRERWARQVSHTVEEVHRVGAVWGDVKADNVLIDKDQNAWVIDFEGGYTDGWVDEGKAGTKEGDLQGLGKILDLMSKGPSE
ncbi:hypothetical protein Daus18300_011639 [Diaporthe australafricana]|uniref:Protein kinase domain-containing protein n=1 Tax=Diaporthe australafricana TaxID=127596 RepID=A0ABR3W5N3_9PEZI